MIPSRVITYGKLYFHADFFNKDLITLKLKANESYLELYKLLSSTQNIYEVSDISVIEIDF